MFDNFEFIFNVVFFCLSIAWIGNILLLTSERQILINPLLMLISSLIIVIPRDAKEVFGFDADNTRVFLYVFYYMVVVIGLLLTRGRKKKLRK